MQTVLQDALNLIVKAKHTEFKYETVYQVIQKIGAELVKLEAQAKAQKDLDGA